MASLRTLVTRHIQTGLPVLVLGKPGIGKALANSELVLTTKGYKTMGSITTDDEAIGVDGLPTKILYVAPQGVRPIYKVLFRNGTTINADEDHLWTVRKRSSKTWVDMTTLELANTKLTHYEKDPRSKNNGNYHRNLYYTPKAAPVVFSHKELPLPPYTLGALLGDGGFTSGCITFTNPDMHIISRMQKELAPLGYALKVNPNSFVNGAYHLRVTKAGATKSFVKFLRDELGIDKCKSTSKHIPAEYLLSSLEQRQALYDGLNATDGWWKGDKLMSYSTSSPVLSQDYVNLARSLGHTTTTSSKIPCYKDSTGAKVYCERSYTTYTVADKGHNAIVSVTFSHYEGATCIKVANSDGLFLTRECIVTHNSSVFQQIAEDNDMEFIDFRASDRSPIDFAGLPVPNHKTGKMDFLPIGQIPLATDELPEGKQGFLLLIDEVSAAVPAVQAALYQLTLDRMIGGKPIHPNCYIGLAGNGVEDGAVAHDISSALISRVALIHHELRLKDWIEDFADPAGVHGIIKAFLRFRPEMFHTYSPDAPNQAYGCARSWTNLSFCIAGHPEGKITPKDRELYAHIIGEGLTTEFLAFYKRLDSLPSREEIMANPHSLQVGRDVGDNYAIAGLLQSMCDASNIEYLMPAIRKLPKEYQVVVVRGIGRQDMSILMLPKVSEWLDESEAYIN